MASLSLNEGRDEPNKLLVGSVTLKGLSISHKLSFFVNVMLIVAPQFRHLEAFYLESF